MLALLLCIYAYNTVSYFNVLLVTTCHVRPMRDLLLVLGHELVHPNQNQTLAVRWKQQCL